MHTCEEHSFEKLIRVSAEDRCLILESTLGDNALIHALSYVANCHATGYVDCRPSEEAVMKMHLEFLTTMGRLSFTPETFDEYIMQKRQGFVSKADDSLFWCAMLSPVTRNICVAQEILKESNVQHRVNVIRLQQVKEAYDLAVKNRERFVEKAQLNAENEIREAERELEKLYLIEDAHLLEEHLLDSDLQQYDQEQQDHLVEVVG
jgi:hypothetical protein